MNENQTISEKELLEAVKILLKKSGHLNKFQAEWLWKSVFWKEDNLTQPKYMRAKVTEILQERQVSQNPGFKSPGAPKPTNEVLLINELIKEYLEWNGYLYTAAVMTSEAAMPGTQKPRAELCAEVGVKDDDKSSALPLLANIVAAYTERIKRKINKSKKDNA